MTGSPPRLLIVDTQSLFRDAMSSAFDAEGFAQVVHAASVTGAEAVAARTHPDLAAVAADLPDRGAARLCHRLKARVEGIGVVVYDRRPDARRLVEAVEARADGYVPLDVDLDGFRDALRQVQLGHSFVPAAMLGALLASLLERREHRDQTQAGLATLTRREREVFTLLAEGSGQQEIGEILGISPQTARTHIQKVIRKLGVRSRVEVAVLAAELGLVDRASA